MGDTPNETMVLYPLNATSLEGVSVLFGCASMALSAGHSHFAAFAGQCYLGNRSILASSNCTEVCVQQGKAGCFYEITDLTLLKLSLENVGTGCCHGNNACSGAPIGNSQLVNMVAILVLPLISRLLYM